MRDSLLAVAARWTTIGGQEIDHAKGSFATAEPILPITASRKWSF
jgi:hypothetical protein